MAETDDTRSQIRLLGWAIGRSDTLRNAYAARGSMVLAAAGSIAAGVVIFIKPETFKVLQRYTLATAAWVLILVACILWCTGCAVWHAVRATTAVSRKRDRIRYAGAKRLWLNVDDTIGTQIESESLFIRALLPFTLSEIILPGEDELAKLGNVRAEQLLPGFIGELVFVLAVQSRRYQRLGWSVVSVATGFILYLVLLFVLAVLTYRA
jgi:hypothetical protein